MRLAILLLLATIIVAEPVVHTHPLAGNGSEGVGIASPAVCAMCAVSAQQITVVRTNVAAPVVITDLLIAAEPHHLSLGTSRSLPSRAPPAA